MTRTSLNRTLRRLYVFLGVVLAVSLVAKFRGEIPGIAGTPVDRALGDAYDYLRDMSLLIATGGVAYLTNVFQKRSKFVESLEEEWRGIVRTKSALYTFCEKQYPTSDDYLSAFCRISETIDNMRIVYCNVGETKTFVGLYPYAPLHDMRRALQSIDPRKRTNIPPEETKLARDAILQSFYALRESFLEELDLNEPAQSALSLCRPPSETTRCDAACAKPRRPTASARTRKILSPRRREIEDLLRPALHGRAAIARHGKRDTQIRT